MKGFFFCINFFTPSANTRLYRVKRAETVPILSTAHGYPRSMQSTEGEGKMNWGQRLNTIHVFASISSGFKPRASSSRRNKAVCYFHNMAPAEPNLSTPKGHHQSTGSMRAKPHHPYSSNFLCFTPSELRLSSNYLLISRTYIRRVSIFVLLIISKWKEPD